jgi:2-keto-3-deoxy-L-rhamnonate aldolase RhmA
LSEPLLNKYWKEDSWRINQDFFLTPNDASFEILQKSGVDWLVIDSSRPIASDFNNYAELIKTSGNMTLWKIINPYRDQVSKQIDPCGPKSVQIGD